MTALPHDAAQSGSLRFTGRMTRVLTAPLKYQIQRALREFPELESQPITVGLTRSSGVDGIAYAEHRLIRLHVRRGRVSSFTVGHELTHLLQPPGLGIVPSGEIPCDIWTLARSEVFLDEKPCYLPIPCRREDWSQHAHAVRRLCLRAIEERRRNRRYMVWLHHHIRAYFAPPVDVVGREELCSSPTPDLDRSGLVLSATRSTRLSRHARRTWRFGRAKVRGFVRKSRLVARAGSDNF